MANNRLRYLVPRRSGSGGRAGEVEAPERSMDPRTDSEITDVEATVVNSGVYREGRRVESPATLADALHSLPDDSSLAWIGLYRPGDDELLAVADQFDLHELAVEDAIVAHQRPKLERYGDTLFVVLRAARYLDDVERVEFGELHIFIGPGFVLTVRHSESPNLAAVRDRMEADPDLLALGPEAVLYAILDAVVDGYAPVVAGLQNDIDEIQAQVFDGDPRVSRRIYELSREVTEFQLAAHPLLDILQALEVGFTKYDTSEELRRYLRDVHDHATIVAERVDHFERLLSKILTVNATLVTQAQNEEIKKISAWAAILFAPTLIGTVYGMNFDHMPELHWLFGYPFALTLMALTCAALYLSFKRRNWL